MHIRILREEDATPKRILIRLDMSYALPKKTTPSRGHSFGDDLECTWCKTSWLSHQTEPSDCPAKELSYREAKGKFSTTKKER